MLKEVDHTASVIDSQTKAKEIHMSNTDVGKLYFSNGMFWSIYESEDQLKRLLKFLEPLGFIVVGEEGETYNTHGGFEETPTQKTSIAKDRKTNLKDLFNQRKVGFVIILIFIVLAWLIS